MIAGETARSRAGACSRGTSCVDPLDGDALRYESPLDETLVCAPCVRAEARRVTRYQVCDRDDCEQRGWRNPHTRRNEYLCGRHHVESGDGVVLNRWAPRVSTPLRPSARPTCEAVGGSGVLATDCFGEVRWRRAADGTSHHLCNRHAGRQSSADAYANRR